VVEKITDGEFGSTEFFDELESFARLEGPRPVKWCTRARA